MQEFEIFYLTGCPYCRNARKAVVELLAENPAYAALPIRWIEERQEPALADSRDYYYVPTIYWKGEKLYEASRSDGFDTIKASFRTAFDRALAG